MTDDDAQIGGRYEIAWVTPPLYALAVEEMKRKGSRAHRVVKEIVASISTLHDQMHAERACCALCDEYHFTVGEPPAAMIVGVPDEGSSSRGIAAPVCGACAEMPLAETMTKIRTSLAKDLGGHEARVN